MDYSLYQLQRFSRGFGVVGAGGSSRVGSGHHPNSKQQQQTREREGHLAHPVIMTERLGTPLHSRALTSELLFEGYGVPSVCFGVDGLFAWEYRMRGGSSGSGSGVGVGAGKGGGSTNGTGLGTGAGTGVQDGLIINMGHQSTILIPVLGNKGLVDRSKR